MKHFISLDDYTKEDILMLLDSAKELKLTPHSDKLKGKSLVMIFEKPSTRTRLSFEIGVTQLGGHAVYAQGHEIGMGIRESVEDVSKVISRYADMVMIRNNSHSDIEEFAKNSTIPVINGLSDMAHPCQAIADLLTIIEHKGTLEGLTAAYVGDGNNVAASLVKACNKGGININIATPKGYELAQDTGNFTPFNSPQDAVKGADVIYTDVWTSMGQEDEYKKRINDFEGFMVDSNLMGNAKPDAIFLHCLPAHRGEEVSAEVLESNASKVFDQAENRLHAQKAIMVYLSNE